MLQYLFSNPSFLFGWIIALIIGLSIHEFAHAFIAHKLGDDTAKNAGRVTLNPLAHMDPIGTLMIFMAGFGWGKPVPVNPYQLKHGKWGHAIVSIAGPASNILTAAVFAMSFRIMIAADISAPTVIVQMLQAIIELNLILAVFNLIPIPPLDGSKILAAIVPNALGNIIEEIEKIGPFVLLGIIIFTIVLNIPLFSRIILPVVNTIEQFLIFWPS